MTGSCQFSLGQRSGAAAWSYDGTSLVVVSEAAAPLSFAVKEIAGISGDDYTLRVRVSGAGDGLEELVLSMLGHDGPTLGEALRRDWLQARQGVLRLGGSGGGWLALGQVAGLDGDNAEPFRALLHEDVLVIAREGRDLEPVFLALTENMLFDVDSYTVRLEEWPGRRMVISKMAKQTDEFVKRLRENRALLAKATAMTLAEVVPGLPTEGRVALAGAWLPGRLLELTRMDALCPGFAAGFRDGWLAGALRHAEGAYLLDWATPGQTWLGCTCEQGDSEGESRGSDEGVLAARALWMLAGKGGTWYLEPLSIEDHATYCFKGGDEVPALVSRLLCAPQFSKQALYSPLGELTADAADLAIPARSLDFLVRLRDRFKGRAIHQSVESWCQEVGKLG
jgi:hypothetical protein